MGKINVLSFAVANLIAAGEVVDRPASVIKELLENAVDAGATQISVEIKNGGTTYMRVSDNGCGIEADDLPVALKRHATSKIKTSEDLNRIISLGFRGEALAAIASVSDLRIISKTRDANWGAMVESRGGEIVDYTEQACRTGTSVIVENLFYNVPARRKFLKRDATETMAVSTIVEKIAMSHPEIGFRLITDGNIRLETPGDGKLESVLYFIYGKEMQSAMIPVFGELNDVRVEGFIGRSDNVKSNRNYQNFFINKRYVKSKLACAAIEQAYTSYLPPEKFPCCVLNLTLNPMTVDINVHPTKLEVKFVNEKPIFEAIYHAVKSALEANTTRPEIYLGKTNAQPQMRMSAEEYRSIASTRKVSEAFAPISDTRAEEKIEQIKYSDAPPAPVPEPVLDQTVGKSEGAAPIESTAPIESGTPIESAADDTPSAVAKKYIEYIKLVSDDPAHIEQLRRESEREQEAEPQQALLNDDVPVQNQKAAESVNSILSYRIVGEVFNSYIIVEREDKMLLVDKHAAHERIIFEKNKAMMKEKEPASQMLIEPMELMLTSEEIATVKDFSEDFERLGFKINPRKYSIEIYSVPTELASADIQDTVTTMISRIKEGTGNPKLTRDIIFEKALYQASCKAAIKAGREYTETHSAWIVEQLMKIPDITFCPHGRPVAMELSKKNLDRQFERT